MAVPVRRLAVFVHVRRMDGIRVAVKAVGALTDVVASWLTADVPRVKLAVVGVIDPATNSTTVTPVSPARARLHPTGNLGIGRGTRTRTRAGEMRRGSVGSDERVRDRRRLTLQRVGSTRRQGQRESEMVKTTHGQRRQSGQADVGAEDGTAGNDRRRRSAARVGEVG